MGFKGETNQPTDPLYTKPKPMLVLIMNLYFTIILHFKPSMFQKKLYFSYNFLFGTTKEGKTAPKGIGSTRDWNAYMRQ